MSKPMVEYQTLEEIEGFKIQNVEYSGVEDDNNCGILLWLFNSNESSVYYKLPHGVRGVILEFILPFERYMNKRMLWNY